MKTLEEIKKMMVAGETVQADEALKELLACSPKPRFASDSWNKKGY